MMNVHKAREYFSAYYEGSLDRGLREGFERTLRTDAQIQAEYRAFERTMVQLDLMKTVEVQPPDDLHERILARIDRAQWEQKQRKATPFAWWKSALIVGAAATAITLAVFQSRPTQGVNQAGFDPVVSNATLGVHATELGVSLDYAPSGKHTVVIREADGTELERIVITGKPMRDKVLSNPTPAAKAIAIDIDGVTTWVVLPGRERSMNSKGKGHLRDLALEIADGCGVAVVLQVKDPTVETSWTLDSADALTTATRAVEPIGKKVELRGDDRHPRALWILDN